ncbi:hypothetical protein EC973_004327 [Apophysomyces ossiformis]|uniref:Uncharacterized protein n=1 Tax=Apophysomyces ossiformis TaxID=679940 RepID=A0A8H7BG23_9FUNG|nr:hypothetical protein EC973_004327 [Apophysomyces ossiformis]
MSTLHKFGFNVRKRGEIHPESTSDLKEKNPLSKESPLLKRTQSATIKQTLPSVDKKTSSLKTTNNQAGCITRYLTKKREKTEDVKRKQVVADEPLKKSKIEKEQTSNTEELDEEEDKEEEEEEEEDLSRPLRKEMTVEEASIYIQQIKDEILQGSSRRDSA